MSRRAAPSAARTRGAPNDTPLVTFEPALDSEHAANLATLRRHWKWAAFSQFFYTFAPLFAMPEVALTDIEDDLARGSALYLPRVVHRLLHVLTQDRKLSMDNWQTVLRRQYLRRDPELNPLGPEPLDPANKVSREPTETREVKDEDAEGMDVDTTNDPATVPQNDAILEGKSEGEDKPATEAIKDEIADIEEPQPEEPLVAEASRDWFDLSMLEKLDSLHLLTEWQFNNPHRLRTTMRSDGDYAEWRIEPIGYDAKTNAYWLIGPDRLWIQRVPPRPASSKRKRKPNPTKANGKASTSKAAAKAAVSESEADALPAKRARPSKGRSSRTRNDPPAQSSTGRGTRAAKLQANEKLDAQKRQMEEFQRQKLAETRSSRSLRNKNRAPPSPSKNALLGTRASARLRGVVRDDDEEWQEIPDEWLSETHESDAKPKTRSNGRLTLSSRKGKARARIVQPSSDEEESESHTGAAAARTGLESDDDVSDLTELSDDQEDAKSEGQPPKEDEPADLALPNEGTVPPPQERPEDKAKDPPNEEATSQLPADFIEWEAICITLAEWEEIAERFAKATHYLEKALHKMLQQVAPEVIDELKEAERKRTIEEAIVHRKRSSRIATKESEKEEARKAALKKAEEDEKQARTRRLEARAKKEESEREKRERARELRRLEREERDHKGQERKTSTAPTMSVTSVRSSMQPSRNNTPSGVRTPDWTLDCELCGMCGVNMDEGAPMVSCGICSRWQHIRCHNQDDARAGRPARNWDDQPFYCRRCKPVAEQRLANGTRHSGGAERRNHGSRSHHSQSHALAQSQKASPSVTPYYPYPQTSDPRYSLPVSQPSSSAYGLPHSPVHGNNVPQPNSTYSRSHRAPGTIAFSHYQPDQHGFTRSPYSNGYPNGMQPQPQPAQYTQPYMANGGYGGNPAYQVPLQQSYSRAPEMQHPISQGPSAMQVGAQWGGMSQGHGHYPSSAARGSMNQYNAADSYGYAHASTNGQQNWPGGPYQHASSSPLPSNLPSNSISPTHPHQHQQPLGNGTYHYPSS